MIVDFNKSPFNSIIYTSSILLEYLKDKKTSNHINDMYSFCINRGMNHSEIFFSMDWLYLTGLIEKVNSKDNILLAKTLTYILEEIDCYNEEGLLIDYSKINNHILEELNINYINKDIIRMNANCIYKLIKDEVMSLNNVSIKNDANLENINAYVEAITSYYFYKFRVLFNEEKVI